MQASTVTRVFEERAQRAPDSPFFHCGATTDPWYTPGQLDVRSACLAGGLAEVGVGRGDRVALLAPNRVEVIEVLLAMAKLGAIQVPLNYWIRGEFLQYQLNDCGARVLIADRAGYETAEPLLAGTGIEHVVILDDEPPAGGYRYEDLAGADPVPAAAVTQGDLLSIVYTSGTTNKPKGCMLSHGYYTSIAGVYGQDDWILPGDRTCTPFPLFHSAGQIVGFTAALVHEVSFAVTPEFHASTFMQHAAALDVTVLIGIGAFANAILDQAEPPSTLPFPRGVWHFARGMAYTRTREPAEAQGELDALHAIAIDPAAAEVSFLDINHADGLLKVADALLRGELLRAQGQHRSGIAALREAVVAEDALNYDEPADWPLPTRWYLGAALLEAGDARGAAEAYRQDLKTYPNNGWSLFGLAQAQRKLGDMAGAADSERHYKLAWQWADAPLTASRY